MTAWLLIVILAVGEGGVQLGLPHASKSDCMNALLTFQHYNKTTLKLDCVKGER